MRASRGSQATEGASAARDVRGCGDPIVIVGAAREPDRAHALLAERARVALVDTPHPGAALSAAHALGMLRPTLVAGPAAAAATLRLAREAGNEIGAVVLESPPAPAADDEPELAATATPTLVLCGTRADTPREYPRWMPNCTLVLVHGAGVDVRADQPEPFAEVVAEFAHRRETIVVPPS